MTQSIRMVILKIRCGDLIKHLQKVFVILVDSIMARVCRVKGFFSQGIHTELMVELFQ